MSREEGIPDLARKTIISHNGTQRTGIIMTKGLNLEDKTRQDNDRGRRRDNDRENNQQSKSTCSRDNSFDSFEKQID